MFELFVLYFKKNRQVIPVNIVQTMVAHAVQIQGSQSVSFMVLGLVLRTSECIWTVFRTHSTRIQTACATLVETLNVPWNACALAQLWFRLHRTCNPFVGYTTLQQHWMPGSFCQRQTV